MSLGVPVVNQIERRHSGLPDGYDVEVTVAPEPGSLCLLGVAALGLLRRRLRRGNVNNLGGCLSSANTRMILTDECL